MEITQTELAKEINVPRQTINNIIQGKANITANIALRLSRYFSLSEFFWLNLQMRYDIETEKDAVAQQLQTEIQKNLCVKVSNDTSSCFVTTYTR